MPEAKKKAPPKRKAPIIKGTGRPKSGYYVDGERVPSVTTILGQFKDPGPLMYWAWDLGMKQIDLREAQKGATSIGTVAHNMVEKFLRDEDPYSVSDCGLSDEDLDRAKQAYEMFHRWWHQVKAKAIALEVPLVTNEHKYAGTVDAILQIDGKYVVGDWKTSNSIYAEYLLQTAAYKALWEEHYPQMPIDGFYILRFSKDFPDFHAHFFSELAEAWETFLLFRKAYDHMKRLKKRAK